VVNGGVVLSMLFSSLPALSLAAAPGSGESAGARPHAVGLDRQSSLPDVAPAPLLLNSRMAGDPAAGPLEAPLVDRLQPPNAGAAASDASKEVASGKEDAAPVRAFVPAALPVSITFNQGAHLVSPDPARNSPRALEGRHRSPSGDGTDVEASQVYGEAGGPFDQPAGLSLLPIWQEPVTSPTLTATVTPTPTVTDILDSTPTPTSTATSIPSVQPPGGTETATETSTATATLTLTATFTPGTPPPGETATATPTLTTTPTPGATATPTITLSPTASLTPTPTPTPTLTPTATLTPTLTPTPTPTPTTAIGQLSLELVANPAQVTPGQVITVGLRLANAGPSALNDVTLNAFLPPALQYQASLGEPTPGYDPRLRMLAWGVGTLAPGQVLELGYQAGIASEASPGALTLAAEAGAAGLATSLEASVTITIEQAVAPTPTPGFEPSLPGPPARIQLAAEPVRDEKREDPGKARPYWLAAYVVDAGGLAVADGTQVQLGVTGGEPAQTTPRTRGGIATTRLDVPPGQAVTVTARAGEASGSLAIGEETGKQLAAQVGRAGDGYGAQARAMVAARNAFSRDGAGLAAENRTRRLSLDGPNLDFTLKGQQAGDESLALSFQLTGVTPSPTLFHG
jgi:hypothetical protein